MAGGIPTYEVRPATDIDPERHVLVFDDPAAMEPFLRLTAHWVDVEVYQQITRDEIWTYYWRSQGRSMAGTSIDLMTDENCHAPHTAKMLREVLEDAAAAESCPRCGRPLQDGPDFDANA